MKYSTTPNINSRRKEIVLRRQVDVAAIVSLIMKLAICVIACCCIIAIFTTLISMKIENVSLKRELQAKTEDIHELTVRCASLEESYSELFTMSEDMGRVIYAQDTELVRLKKDNLELEKDYENVLVEYNKLSSREELFDKYEYAIIFDGKRTGLKYDDIRLGVELMTENGYDPNIMFGMMGIESSYNPDCKNKTSTATGLGQFLKGTGKWVYEELLENGKNTYSHDMAYDSQINIMMMAEYINYLMKKNDNDLIRSIKNYCGKDDKGTAWYISRCNDIMGSYGNIYTIAKQYK